MYVCYLYLQGQIPVLRDTGAAAEDTKMPSVEPVVEPVGEEQTMEEPEIGGEQTMGEPKTGGEQTMGEPETSGEPEVQKTLVPSSVVEVTPLQIDDSPLRPRQSASGARSAVVPEGEAKVQFRAGYSYSRKKKMGRKEMVDYVGSSLDD